MSLASFAYACWNPSESVISFNRPDARLEGNYHTRIPDELRALKINLRK